MVDYKIELNQLLDKKKELEEKRQMFRTQMMNKYGTKLWFLQNSGRKDEETQYAKEIGLQIEEINKRLEILQQYVKWQDDIKLHQEEMSVNEELFSKAKEHYGITNNYAIVGYILPDGQMLNFGSYGVRDTDHRNIAYIYKELGVEINAQYQTDYMNDFINRGAIRFMPESDGFTISKEPTKEQYTRIKEITRRAGGEIIIDFAESNGDTDCYVEYIQAKPQRVVMDIMRYYQDGIRPEGDSMIESMKCKLVLESVDMSNVGQVNYSWDFDEDYYNEWLVENEYEADDKNLIEYIKENVIFELEYLDNETYHSFDYESMDYDSLEYAFGEKMANNILQQCLKKGDGSFETYELYKDDTFDINNPNELNAIAVKLLQHGKYYKDCRGFILTNGEIVYTPAEHNQCTIIDGVKNTFHFIELGNIRILQNSIDLAKEPTPEQIKVLRQVINSYQGQHLYLDIFADREYGVRYMNPDYRYVIGEILRFFREGIKPQGNRAYEERNTQNRGVLNESKEENFEVISCWGCPDEVYYTNNQNDTIKELDYETYGYTFGIWDNTLVCGNDNDETSSLCHDDLIMYHVIYHGWEDIMPAREVNEDAWDWDTLCNTQVDYYDDEEYPSYHDEETGEVLEEYQKSYGDLLKELGEPFARGRILYDFDRGISFISFWEEPAIEEVELIAKEYGNLAKRAYWISLNHKNEADVYYKEYKPFRLIDWLNRDIERPQITKDDEQFAIHNLPAAEKHEKLRGWMDMHNKVMYDKLAYRDHDGNIKTDKEPMTLAQYHSLIYQENKGTNKSTINESVLSDLNMEVNGGADDFEILKNGKCIAWYYYDDSTAYPIIVCGNKIYYGNQGRTHKDVYCKIAGYKDYYELMNKFGRDAHEEYESIQDKVEEMYPNNNVEARIWIQPKTDEFPYAVLFFWSAMKENLNNYKQQVQEIANKFGINTDNLVIGTVSGPFEPDSQLITYNEWLGNVPEMGSEELKRKQLHNLPPQEKWKALRGWMDMHNKVMNDKLAYRDHEGNIRTDKEPMTLAQYHSIIYQEQVEK